MIKKATVSSGSTDLTTIATDVKPNTDNANTLGSSSKRWSNVFGTTVTTGALTAPTSTAFTFTSNTANSGSNIAFTLNNSVTLSGSTKLVSITNNGSEKCYVNYDGSVIAGPSGVGNLSAKFHGDEQNVARISMFVFTNQAAIHYSGRCGDAADSVAHRFGNATSLTTSGAQIAAFYSDSITTKKAFIDKDGQFENAVAGKGIILKSPDGTRYLLTIANGGTVSVSAA